MNINIDTGNAQCTHVKKANIKEQDN